MRKATGVRLTQVHVYPIKSCRGSSLVQATVGQRGIEGDRQWMVVNPEGRFLSQRRHPRMALIEPELGSEHLTLRAPGMEPLRLERRGDGPALDVEIWRNRCPAVDQGDETAAWISSFLGAPVRLVRQSEGANRPVDPEYARGPTDQVSFADGYPFLLAAEASLDDLNGRLLDALPMNRFRPNLVVAGSRPFDEDGWRAVRVGEIAFDVVKPCARCVITTVDQATGRKGKEPLRTLATFRSPPAGKKGGEVYFGQNLIHREGGTLEVGSPVEVLEEVEPGRD